MSTFNLDHFIYKQSSVSPIANVSPPSAPENPLPSELLQLLENHRKDYPGITDAGNDYKQILNSLKYFQIEKLKPDMYWYLYKLLLFLEQYRGIVEMRKYKLWYQELRHSQVRKGELVISVPGLSEERPSLRPHDILTLTEIDDKIHDRCVIKYVGQNYVTIRPSIKLTTSLKPDMRFNIEFEFTSWTSDIQHSVLDIANKTGLIKSVFPVGHEHVPKLDEEINWINPSIARNSRQKQAIKNILQKSSSPAPYVLFGPPGTGKTSTLVEAITQIHLRNPASRILICTPSNSAADEIAKRLLHNSVSEYSIYRMYSASKNHEDIDDLLKGCSNFATNEAVYVTRDVFMTKKIIITTLATCIRIRTYRLRPNHFEYLFIDEAGQATETETLIPILVLSGELEQEICGQIVIAGDPKQLGPVCQSTIGECLFEISMLERLMKSPPYKKNKTTGYDENYVTKLINNYRSHPAILHIPNKLFYDDELLAMGGRHTTIAENWEHLPKKNFPIIFHATRAQESREASSPSVCNYFEITIIMDYIDLLLKTKFDGKQIQQENIGIVTPYALQRTKIHQKLNERCLKNIQIGTVETFQGQERDVIIISTVRTCLYQHNGKIHPGFLANPKRFNVAITRAKALLIVIGSPQVLKYDPNWREFIEYCKINRSCRGMTFDLDRQIGYRELQSMIAKKHEMIVPKPDSSMPIVEDPKSAYNFVENENYEDLEDEIPRRRRIPIGPVFNDESNSSDESDYDDDDDDDDDGTISEDDSSISLESLNTDSEDFNEAMIVSPSCELENISDCSSESEIITISPENTNESDEEDFMEILKKKMKKMII